MTRSSVARSLLGAAVLLVTSTVQGQAVRHPSAILLKRLAEAVDGNRTGDSVFVVASYDSLSPVRGVFLSRDQAEAAARLAGRSYDVFGPFITMPELASGSIVVGCVHNARTSYWEPVCPQASFRASDVARISLRVQTRDGRTREFPVSSEVDAIFLSLPAIDKFVIPYYARIIGVQSAAAMRARVAAAIR